MTYNDSLLSVSRESVVSKLRKKVSTYASALLTRDLDILDKSIVGKA
jgi:hypothetical protein